MHEKSIRSLMCLIIIGCLLLCTVMLPSPSQMVASSGTVAPPNAAGETGHNETDYNEKVYNDRLVLSRENVVELALDNYIILQENQLQSRTRTAQFVYLYAQRSLAAMPIQRPQTERLPVTMEEFIALLPDYDELVEEDKLQLEAVLAVQGMINASLNAYQEAQVAQHYEALLLEQQRTLDSYDEQIRQASAGFLADTLETDRVKLLVQFYALHSYYQLKLLDNEIQAAKAEASYLEQRQEDAKQLYAAGLLTETELEQEGVAVTRQRELVEELELKLAYELLLLKLDLGIAPSRLVVWSEDEAEEDTSRNAHVVEMDIELDKLLDMKKADEAIRQAQADYERVQKESQQLANYYLVTLNIQKDNKLVIKRQLEKRVAELREEGEQLQRQLARLKLDKQQLLAKRGQSNTLYAYGQIAGREVEQLDGQLARLDYEIQAAYLNYELWKEKKSLAIQGLL